jgi:CMP-N-acetylneuraminate monooxygenase
MKITKINKLKYENKSFIVEILKKDLHFIINTTNDFIIVKKNNKFSIYDRKCDHAGGKILSRKNEHICPMHNWIFYPERGYYNNGVKKKQLDFTEDKDKLYIKTIKSYPTIKTSNKKLPVKIIFFNHAFLQIKSKNVSFVTDPWALGPAFSTGWWLKKNTRVDWINIVNKSDFIYISHNHPDHLHQMTLKNVNKNKLIITPKFKSRSVSKLLNDMNFKNILELDFDKEYHWDNSKLIFSLFKSGDFREDSGIYFSLGEFKALLDVDSNNINFNKLPKVDLYASSFAGGASGFPLMFENYSIIQKKNIGLKYLMATKAIKNTNLKSIEPKYFLPYAGFFTEKLNRDKFIFKNNKKNKITDYAKICENLNINLLDVEKNDEFSFLGSNLIKKRFSKKNRIKDIDHNKYLLTLKAKYKTLDNAYIRSYFENSNFHANLLINVKLSDSYFKRTYYTFSVNFSKNNIKFVENLLIKNLPKKMRVLNLTVRKESFLSTIYNKNPWEDLLIGFQCKVYREPNEYNVDFWNHFSNIYISEKMIRTTSPCNNCNILNHEIDKLL